MNEVRVHTFLDTHEAKDGIRAFLHSVNLGNSTMYILFLMGFEI